MLAIALLLAQRFVDDYVYEEEPTEQYEEYDVQYEEDEMFEEYDVEQEEFDVEAEEDDVEMEEDVEAWYDEVKTTAKNMKSSLQQTVNKYLWIVVGCLSGLVLLFMFTTICCSCRAKKMRKQLTLA